MAVQRGDGEPAKGSPEATVDQKRESSPDDGYQSTDDSSVHVFSDPARAELWKKRYEDAGYENRHRFDPNYQWTEAEEKKLVRKVRRPRNRAGPTRVC